MSPTRLPPLNGFRPHPVPPTRALPSNPPGKLSRPLRLSLVLTLVGILSAGCGGGADSVSDPFAGTPWTLDGPEVRIGSLDDPDYVFWPVTGLVEGPDGGLHSMHWGEAEIRRWSPEGAPAGSVGREGEGPGEFQAVAGLGFFGDSLWVWDRRGYRVSYFDKDGNFLGSVSPRVEIGTMEESPPRPSSPLRDGTFLGVSPGWSHGIATGTLTEAPYALLDSDGQRLATIWSRAYLPRDVFAILADDGVGGSFSSQPFGDDSRTAVGERGLLVLERRVWTGTGEPTVQVSRIDFNGDTLFTAAIPYEPVPLQGERFDSVLATLTESWTGRSGPFSASAADVREALYRPQYLPAVNAIMEAGDGTIWLRRFDPIVSESGEPTTEWWVLDPDGAPLARALTPSGLSVRAISQDAVWGVERDELDVEYIVRYRLMKGD